MAVVDAGNNIQVLVDAIQDEVQGFNPVRWIALNFFQNQQGGNNHFFIKVLCFEDQPQNCVHVHIQTDAVGQNPVFIGRQVGNHTVADGIEAF